MVDYSFADGNLFDTKHNVTLGRSLGLPESLRGKINYFLLREGWDITYGRTSVFS